jgi:hypothetical protein
VNIIGDMAGILPLVGRSAVSIKPQENGPSSRRAL